MQAYVEGYVIGYQLAGSEALYEEPRGAPYESWERAAKVFKSREAAVRFARKHYDNLLGKYVRPMLYYTDNPKNARGMTPLGEHSESMLKKAYVVTSPEQEKRNEALRAS